MYKLFSQSIVVVGSLNPAIIQPPWLIRCKVLDKDDEVGFKFPIGAVIAPISFEYNNYEWSIDYNKLQLTVKNKEELVDLGKIISKIFFDLQHTPVKGLGVRIREVGLV